MLAITQLVGFGVMTAEAAGPPDITPDAFDIANINESGGSGFLAVGAGVGITGINQTISIRATMSAVSGAASATLRQYRSGVQVDSVAVSAGADTEATYNAGNTLHFAVTTTGAPGNSKSFTVTITNQTDGGVVLDAFTSMTFIDI